MTVTEHAKQELPAASLIDAYVRGFLGYGNPVARYWFIGLEQGGGEKEEFGARLTAWDLRGRRAFESLREYHEAFNYTAYAKRRGHWFQGAGRLQPTWSRLIRILLAAEHRPSETDDVRHYQVHELGRDNGETALTELLALPTRRMSEWHYGTDWPDLPYLATRDLCRQETASPRIGMMRHLIDANRPRAVVCYGERECTFWSELAESSFEDTDLRWLRRAFRGTVPIYTMPHAAWRCLPPSYFAEVGARIALN